MTRSGTSRPRSLRASTPWPLVAPAVLAVALLSLPVVGLLQRAPWSTMIERLAEPEIPDAIRVSLIGSVPAAGSRRVDCSQSAH